MRTNKYLYRVYCIVIGMCALMVTGVSAVMVGDNAPDFQAKAVVGADLQRVSLDDYKGKWVVLFFYPIDFSSVCSSEVIAFEEQKEAFDKVEAALIGVSVDSESSHFAWTQRSREDNGVGAIHYALLSDLNRQISADYGVLLKSGIAVRGLFIIDPDQCVRHIMINDTPIGRNIDEVLRVLKALQYFDKTGNGCPANWRDGDTTVIFNPTNSREYLRPANQVL